MDYKEFFVEERDSVDLGNLVAGHIPKDQYISAHKNTIIVCADVLIYYNGGYLLVQRDNVPAKGELWPIGGRLQRGISVEEGIKKKAKEECGLELRNLNLVCMGRTGFKTDPFGHGKGTDTINFMYTAQGLGTMQLDKLHSRPQIINFEAFENKKSKLHPYVVYFLEKAFKNNNL